MIVQSHQHFLGFTGPKYFTGTKTRVLNIIMRNINSEEVSKKNHPFSYKLRTFDTPPKAKPQNLSAKSRNNLNFEVFLIVPCKNISYTVLNF